MARPRYLRIAEHYEKCLAKHGATAQGMDWPNEEDLRARFRVMLECTRWHGAMDRAMSLLDVGCGAGLLLDFIQSDRRYNNFSYHGLDVSTAMIASAKARHKNEDFVLRDILADPLPTKSYDYVVMNGVLTEKLALSYDYMVSFAQKMISAAFSACRYGIAFNAMSSHVDWERNDLFHWPLDEVVGFLKKEVGRNIVVRMDYGLYEYFVYVYRDAHR